MSTGRYFSEKAIRSASSVLYGYFLVSEIVCWPLVLGNTCTDGILGSRIGLCITNSSPVFCFLSYLTALTTVTPQLSKCLVPSSASQFRKEYCADYRTVTPLVGDLAPAHRRATALSIVVSGLLLGLIVARLLSGVVTELNSWRNIHWLAFTLKYLILILL